MANAYRGVDGTDFFTKQYPLYCMKMSDFLALSALEPHNALRKKGLVVPLDLEGAHQTADINFVSHQWLGYTVADPKGDHLGTMQAAFRRAIAEGKGVSKPRNPRHFEVIEGRRHYIECIRHF